MNPAKSMWVCVADDGDDVRGGCRPTSDVDGQADVETASFLTSAACRRPPSSNGCASTGTASAMARNVCVRDEVGERDLPTLLRLAVAV